MTQTVERIVDVVPGWVWIIVGVLGLLSAAFATSSWGATLRARRLSRQRLRLAEDVGLLQAALLPTVPDRLGPLRASVAYRPAEGPAAGGDFYDVFALADDRVAVMVGDISGHGRSALPQTALIRYTLRAYLESGLAPRAALGAAGVALEHQLDEDCYATVAIAVHDPHEGTLTYACAGHPAPIVLAGAPLEPVLASASPPIGVGLPTGLRQTTIRLAGPAQACLFTDGLVEARTDGELFGSERLLRTLSKLGPEANAERLLAGVVAQTDRRPDDMAACLLALDAPRGSGTVVHTEELEVDEAALDSPRPWRFLLACGLDELHAKRSLRALRATLAHGGCALMRVVLAAPATVEIERCTPMSVIATHPPIPTGPRQPPTEHPIGSSLLS